VPVVRRQDHGYDPHLAQIRIGYVIAQERTELLQNKALHTQVPMAGTLFVSSHDTRLQGGSNAAKENFTLRRLAVRVTRP
jgi:hypothetical protein